MGYVSYETLIAQESYMATGVVSLVLGFLLISYFFM